jgi:DNA (cytosine-5)-methyltransferase 1
MRRLKVGSLFSGIGGFDLGLQRAGFEIAWQSEIDPFCLKVLEKHWPHVPKYGDIRGLRGVTLNQLTLFVEDFPVNHSPAPGSEEARQMTVTSA